jgi:hypothetical protein
VFVRYPPGKIRYQGDRPVALLAPHYTLLLADAVRRAESAGAELVRALAQLGEGWARLGIRPETVVDPIRATLRAEERSSPPALGQAA